MGVAPAARTCGETEINRPNQVHLLLLLQGEPLTRPARVLKPQLVQLLIAIHVLQENLQVTGTCAHVRPAVALRKRSACKRSLNQARMRP